MHNSNFLSGKNIRLRLAEEADAEFILSLRVDETKSRFLSRVDNDLDRQVAWLRNYKVRERNGEEFYFIITAHSGERFGTVRLYDFQGDSFCWGSWLLKAGSPVSCAIESALVVYEFAFYQLQFTRSHFDVRRENLKVRAFHERMGAVLVDEDELDSFYRYDIVTYEKIRPRYAKYLCERGA